jgi:hypothetical protein
MAAPSPRYYLRRPGFKQVSLPGPQWSSEFMEAYTAAIEAAAPRIDIGASRTRPGTVNAVIISYVQSSAFGALASTTRGMRRAALALP